MPYVPPDWIAGNYQKQCHSGCAERLTRTAESGLDSMKRVDRFTANRLKPHCGRRSMSVIQGHPKTKMTARVVAERRKAGDFGLLIGIAKAGGRPRCEKK
jgi:hypothetical protein